MLSVYHLSFSIVCLMAAPKCGPHRQVRKPAAPQMPAQRWLRSDHNCFMAVGPVTQVTLVVNYDLPDVNKNTFDSICDVSGNVECEALTTMCLDITEQIEEPLHARAYHGTPGFTIRHCNCRCQDGVVQKRSSYFMVQ